MKRLAVPFAALLTLTLSGCATETWLSYIGEGGGSDRETLPCDKIPFLLSEMEIERGNLTVVVRDNIREVRISDTYTGPMQGRNQQPVRGVTGEWEVQAYRSQEFRGRYQFTLRCPK